MQNETRRPALTMTLVLLLATGACQSRSDRAGGAESAARDKATPADSMATPADSAAMGTSTGSPAASKGGMTDEAILGMLDGANKADSVGGALAAKKATDPEVKAFAQLMMSEHHAMRVEGEELAKKLGITPKQPEKDPVAGYAAAETAALQKAKKGEDFDKTYIDNEVTLHQAVLDAANMARVATGKQEIKDLIQKAAPIIQKHLDQAQTIQKRLSPTA
jgi:putative membrane protein